MKQEKLYKTLLSPHVSEKSARVADTGNQVVFKVLIDATKPDIKKAVEMLFDVKVTAVQVLKCKGKKKRFSRTLGRRSDWKKAYVTLAEGYDIDFMGPEAG